MIGWTFIKMSDYVTIPKLLCLCQPRASTNPEAETKELPDGCASMRTNKVSLFGAVVPIASQVSLLYPAKVANQVLEESGRRIEQVSSKQLPPDRWPWTKI